MPRSVPGNSSVTFLMNNLLLFHTLTHTHTNTHIVICQERVTELRKRTLPPLALVNPPELTDWPD